MDSSLAFTIIWSLLLARMKKATAVKVKAANPITIGMYMGISIIANSIFFLLEIRLIPDNDCFHRFLVQR